MDDDGFVFIVPFFVAWILVLPGTIYNEYKIRKEIAHAEEYYRTHQFEEDDNELEVK